MSAELSKMTWEKGRGVVLRRRKTPEVQTARMLVTAAELERELPDYWQRVREVYGRIVVEVRKQPRLGRFKEVFLETCLRPGFSVDVRKGFHGNIESTSCSAITITYADRIVLEGFTLALVYARIRRDWLESYELLNIFEDQVEISYSGVKHVV